MQPFDVQNLSLEIHSSWKAEHVKFVKTLKLVGETESTGQKSFLDKKHFILEEWQLEKVKSDKDSAQDDILLKVSKTDIEDSPSSCEYSTLRISVSVSRRWGFYAWNMFSVLVSPYRHARVIYSCTYSHIELNNFAVYFAVLDRLHNIHDWHAR